MPKLKNILQDLGSFVVPAATTLGAAALTGGMSLGPTAYLAAGGAGARGFARNEEQERLRKMMRRQAEEDRRAQAMANLINALQPGTGARARPAEIAMPKRGLGETIAGGAAQGIQAYQLAKSAQEALEDRILNRKVIESQLPKEAAPLRGPIGTLGGATGGATGGTPSFLQTITDVAQYGPADTSKLTPGTDIKGTLFKDIKIPGTEYRTTGRGIEELVGPSTRPLGDITTKQFFESPHLAAALGKGASARAKEDLARATTGAASQQERLNVFIQNVGNKLAYDNVAQDDVNGEALKIFMEMGLGDDKDFEPIKGSIVTSWRAARQQRAGENENTLDGILTLAGDAYDGQTVDGALELYLSQAHQKNINLTESEAATAARAILAKASGMDLSEENKKLFAGYTYIDASLVSVQDHFRSILPDKSTLLSDSPLTLSGEAYDKARHDEFNKAFGILAGRVTDLEVEIGKAILSDDIADALSRVGFTVEFAGRVFSGAQVRPDEADLLRNIFIGGFTSTPERVLRDTGLFREQLKNMRMSLASAGMGARTGNVYAFLTNKHLASLVSEDDPIAREELRSRRDRLRVKLGRDPTPEDLKGFAWGSMAGSVTYQDMIQRIRARTTNLADFIPK